MALIEDCCSLSSEGSAEAQVGRTSVCYVGLAVEGCRELAVALVGTGTPQSSTSGLVVEQVVTDFAVLPQAFSSPDLL